MIVEADGLVKRYGGRRVLDGVSFAVPAGSVLALLGPNGAGKTTAVRVLATLTRPDGGAARIGGHDVLSHPLAVRRLISLTGQFAAVDDRQTGRENLEMVARLRHLGRPGAPPGAEDLLQRFDLGPAADRYVQTWSGGMRRRLDLAMSLVSPPAVLFLDEPTTGLDPVSRTTMWAAVRELVTDGTTVLLTTQYLEEADRLADRIVLLDRGRVTAEGAPDDLKARVGGERLVLTFPTTVERDRAVTLLAPDGAPVSPTEATVPSDGSADSLRRVLELLHAHGIPVARVTGNRPTLDDVFLALTVGSPTAGDSPTARAAVPA